MLTHILMLNGCRMNYVDHCTEQGMAVPTEPVVFSKFASAITEPGTLTQLLPTRYVVLGLCLFLLPAWFFELYSV